MRGNVLFQPMAHAMDHILPPLPGLTCPEDFHRTHRKGRDVRATRQISFVIGSIPKIDYKWFEMSFFRELWSEYRLYLHKLALDFLIAATVWVALFIFRILTRFLPVGDWAGRFIVEIHSTGIVLAFFLFALLSAIDIIKLRKGAGTSICFA